MKSVFQALRLFLWLSIVTGAAYPLIVLIVGNTTFPSKANGSLMKESERVVGSALIGQRFEENRYFWPRPSVTNYNPLPSGASNFGPTSSKLKETILERRAKFGDEAPVEFLTASGSGLDPHISPEAALMQIPRVSYSRNLGTAGERKLEKLVNLMTESPDFGFLGQPRANVLRLNIALDQLLMED